MEPYRAGAARDQGRTAHHAVSMSGRSVYKQYNGFCTRRIVPVVLMGGVSGFSEENKLKDQGEAEAAASARSRQVARETTKRRQCDELDPIACSK